MSAAGALLTGCFACGTDLAWRRIPNVITFGSALAGFARAASGEDLTFAFIINGSLPTALTLSDQVAVALAEYGKGVSLDALGPASAPS